MTDINERIRQTRKESGLTQRAFGEKIGVTGSSVNKLESGENNPSDQTIKLISREFGVDHLWLKTGAGDMFNNEADELQTKIDLLLTGENETARTLFKALADLEVSDWVVIQKLIEAFKK